MNVDTAKFLGYALQLLLVLVLVVSLACKSWSLLIVCLFGATALLALVCYQMITRQAIFKNVRLMKTSSEETRLPMTQPYIVNEPANIHQEVVDMEPMTSLTPPVYIPPIYQQLTRNEQTAMQIMSMSDRGVSMHAPVRPDFNQYVVPVSQGIDLHPHTTPYSMKVQGSNQVLPVHLDDMHPDNPMNSLSYLSQH